MPLPYLNRLGFTIPLPSYTIFGSLCLCTPMPLPDRGSLCLCTPMPLPDRTILPFHTTPLLDKSQQSPRHFAYAFRYCAKQSIPCLCVTLPHRAELWATMPWLCIAYFARAVQNKAVHRDALPLLIPSSSTDTRSDRKSLSSSIDPSLFVSSSPAMPEGVPR